MALVDLDGRYMEVNTAFCEIVGYSAERLVGMTVDEITHPDDLAISADERTPVEDESDHNPTVELRFVRLEQGSGLAGGGVVDPCRDRGQH